MKRQTVGYHIIQIVVLSLGFFVWLTCQVFRESAAVELQVPVAIIISIVMAITMGVIVRCVYFDGKEIRAKASADYANGTLKKDASKVTLPLKKAFSGEYSFKETDKKIKQTLSGISLFMLLAICFLLLMYPIMGRIQVRTQDSIFIVSGEDGEQAMIYNNGDVAILAECKETKGDVLNIYTDIQSIVPVEGLKYVFREYDNIIIDPLEKAAE